MARYFFFAAFFAAFFAGAFLAAFLVAICLFSLFDGLHRVLHLKNAVEKMYRFMFRKCQEKNDTMVEKEATTLPPKNRFALDLRSNASHAAARATNQRANPG
jgi:hypothetical protein